MFVVSTKAGVGSPKLVTLFLSLFDLSQKTEEPFLKFILQNFLENVTSNLLGVLKLLKISEKN